MTLFTTKHTARRGKVKRHRLSPLLVGLGLSTLSSEDTLTYSHLQCNPIDVHNQEYNTSKELAPRK
jgi:hypothetical protein